MIFQHTVDMVLSGGKVQTRRIAKEFDGPIYDWFKPHPFAGHVELGEAIRAVFRNGMKLYEVGQQIAVQPGRGQKAVGRIEITGIRREDVRQISHEDARAEGFKSQLDFLETWCNIHDPKTSDEWEHLSDSGKHGLLSLVRPERYQAWVLEFKLVEGGS